MIFTMQTDSNLSLLLIKGRPRLILSLAHSFNFDRSSICMDRGSSCDRSNPIFSIICQILSIRGYERKDISLEKRPTDCRMIGLKLGAVFVAQAWSSLDP